MGKVLTANEIFNNLVNDDKILESNGRITFELGGVNIVVKQRDVVGNIIQEWLEGWMANKGIYFRGNPNTQMPPDFFLLPDSSRNGLLEIKAFNADAAPGFDIADFTAYCRTLLSQPWMLDADFMIFAYKMDANGLVSISNVWLKKVWQICCASDKWPVKVQEKKGVIHKIRPATWYSTKTKYPCFTCVEHFLSALEQTLYDYPETRHLSSGAHWRKEMEKAYKGFFKTPIQIQRWDEGVSDLYTPSQMNN